MLAQKEPELLYGNEELWAFINFAGEDHTNMHTLVAFLRVLKALVCVNYLCVCMQFWSVQGHFNCFGVFQASNEEGASKVFELLQGKMFRSVRWSTLFDCISIYEEKFKQSLQSSGSMLPEFEEADAQVLVAYLDVLQKVCI